jgi:hypothetical protein
MALVLCYQFCHVPQIYLLVGKKILYVNFLWYMFLVGKKILYANFLWYMFFDGMPPFVVHRDEFVPQIRSPMPQIRLSCCFVDVGNQKQIE